MLKNFTNLNEKEKLEVLEWRNHRDTAHFMHTQEISLSSHLSFIEKLKSDTSQQYFLVDAIGVINLKNITKSSAELGLYKNPYKSGVGTQLMQEALTYAFESLKLKMITLEVYNFNTKAIHLYKKFGFKEVNRKENLVIMEKMREDR